MYIVLGVFYTPFLPCRSCSSLFDETMLFTGNTSQHLKVCTQSTDVPVCMCVAYVVCMCFALLERLVVTGDCRAGSPGSDILYWPILYILPRMSSRHTSRTLQGSWTVLGVISADCGESFRYT